MLWKQQAKCQDRCHINESHTNRYVAGVDVVVLWVIKFFHLQWNKSTIVYRYNDQIAQALNININNSFAL